MARKLVIAGAIFWFILIVLSVAHPVLTAPEGDGFTRGYNRIGLFLGWQLAGVFLALVTGIAYTRLERPTGFMTRLCGLGPAIYSGLLVLALIALFIWLRISP